MVVPLGGNRSLRCLPAAVLSCVDKKVPKEATGEGLSGLLPQAKPPPLAPPGPLYRFCSLPFPAIRVRASKPLPASQQQRI